MVLIESYASLKQEDTIMYLFSMKSVDDTYTRFTF